MPARRRCRLPHWVGFRRAIAEARRAVTSPRSLRRQRPHQHSSACMRLTPVRIFRAQATYACAEYQTINLFYTRSHAMGGQSTSTQTQQSQTAPWQAAQPMLQGILSQLGSNLNNTGLTSTESGALDTLRNNAQQGNPY